MAAETPEITLHTYFRSSCSARVRMALNLKKLPYTPVYIHLLKNEHSSPSYATVNPSGAVPTITFTSSSDKTDTFVLTQSIAILEYLEETFPAPEYRALLPSSPVDRARVRQLCNIIACDVQPVTNLRILRDVKAFATAAGRDAEAAGVEWQQKYMDAGLAAYETVLTEGKTAGKYSVGDEITMADLCLLPAVDAAERFGVDVAGRFPAVERVRRALEEVDEVVRGGWRAQGDTPAEFRC
ncbi:hypothetical protein Dda_9122 [Drechslerella dactyloides]|uniref:Maleylacetoacetate isomerase n=1 Tax=Drechslerella dactyloides TaxID=74499 RepID=A0AAD6NF90_DREDA|nr:hypothetical protein Dda_9122 [Drechslerella dactyloides]